MTLPIIRVALLCLAVTACARSSSPQEVGHGTYRIGTSAVHAFGGSDGARVRAIEEAEGYCQGRGREVLLIRADTDPGSGSPGSRGRAEVHFRCVPQGDPALRRAELERGEPASRKLD